MTTLAELFRNAVAAGHWIALPSAFAGGVLVSLNPCCLALYPAATATCCAGTGTRRSSPLAYAILFALGITVATASLGLLAALAGRAMVGLGSWTAYVLGLIPILMGLHLLGWVRIPLPKTKFSNNRPGVLGAFLAGLLVFLVIGPCGTPILAAILAVAARQGQLAAGAGLLVAYGFGTSLPLLAAGAVAGGMTRLAGAERWQAHVQTIAGIGLIAIGFYLIWQTP